MTEAFTPDPGTILTAFQGGEPIETVQTLHPLGLHRHQVVNAGLAPDWEMAHTVNSGLHQACPMCRHTLLPVPEPEGFPFRRTFQGRKVCGDCHDEIVDLELEAADAEEDRHR